MSLGGLGYVVIVRCEAPMCLDDQIAGYAGLALQAVNVLRKELQQQPLLVQQIYERVCDGRSVFAWV